MAAQRTPGPICQTMHPSDIDDGTNCRAASPTPGPDLVTGSAVPVGVGAAAVVRIPVPGTNGLYIEFNPRFAPGGWKPKGGSTSTLFIQDTAGKRVLRLDYGFNKTTGVADYHWNQKGTFADFGIADHTVAGPTGEALFKGAQYFKYAGRAFLVAGIVMDAYSIVVAKKRWRQVARVAAGWAGADAGCTIGGSWGAGGGTVVEPGGGTAAGGVAGCIVGGIAGYAGAAWAAGHVYDFVEETFFEPVPPVPAPK